MESERPTSQNRSSRPTTPGSRKSNQEPNPFTELVDSDIDDQTMGAARSQQGDADSVKIPIDCNEMDSVDLDSVKDVKTEQPEKKIKKAQSTASLHYHDRDPENLQTAVKVNFADIIAEPSGAHSFDTIWGTSYKVYSVTKYWVYRVLTLIFGVPLALFWGLYFSVLAFCSIWWVMPCIRAIGIKMNFVGKLWSLCIRTFLDPIFESIGLIMSRIRVMLTLRNE